MREHPGVEPDEEPSLITPTLVGWSQSQIEAAALAIGNIQRTNRRVVPREDLLKTLPPSRRESLLRQARAALFAATEAGD